MASVSAFQRKYDHHLRLCRDWLLRSIRPGGGSRAHFTPLLGWSKAYPETSGYIATSLLAIERRLGDERCGEAARGLGRWLLSIQEENGCWKGGLHPYPDRARPSIFNTGQILNGLNALCRSGEMQFAESAERAARWLAHGVGADGIWTEGHYRGHQPDYYSFVAWPMLDHADRTGDGQVRMAAERVVRRVIGNQRANGAFELWGFDPGRPAFTHTIGYTLQGLIESDAFLDGGIDALSPTKDALERLRRQAELGNGRLPGSFDTDWKADRSFECLTGSAQAAICLLLVHRREPDLRLLNAAAKLVERLCRAQSAGPVPALRGALAGSKPLWGPYMRLRYPNWAVKFFADALMLMIDALDADARTDR